jgi:hypothetical protein
MPLSEPGGSDVLHGDGNELIGCVLVFLAIIIVFAVWSEEEKIPKYSCAISRVFNCACRFFPLFFF